MAESSLLTSIEFLKGVGPKRAEVLRSELGVTTFQDLLNHFPFRYIDKTSFHNIRDIASEMEPVQLI
ncbi:MAG: hypothetical protein AAF193_08925, partial [Bacteroidota bacterium]